MLCSVFYACGYVFIMGSTYFFPVCFVCESGCGFYVNNWSQRQKASSKNAQLDVFD